MKLFGMCFIFVVFICGYFVWEDNKRFADRAEPLFNEWVGELEEARQLNLTTEEFLERNKDKGNFEVGVLGKMEIVVRNDISSLFCKSYTVRVYYASDGGDGARLTSVSANGEGSLCFM